MSSLNGEARDGLRSPSVAAHTHPANNFISLSKLKSYMPKGLGSLELRRRSQETIISLDAGQFSPSRLDLGEQTHAPRDNLHLNDQRSFRCSRANQILAAGLNQSAMVATESHLNQLNHYYIANNSTSLGMNHPHHQTNHHHYAYNSQSTGTVQSHQHHHLAASVAAAASSHEQSAAAYNHIASQHQHQQHQQHQHHQGSQHQAAGLTGHQSIYQQIATVNNVAGMGGNGGMACGGNHGYPNNNAHYHGQLQSTNNQASNLISDTHQNHLNSAAAVVSQTLKTVANQHNQQHHHYGGSISDGLTGNAAGLMNMTAHQQQQFHGVNTLSQHHHHLVGQSQVVGGISLQSNHQHQHHHQSQQNQAQNIPIHQANSIVARKYQCKMCPQVFMSKAEMKYHNQNHLREAKPYKCLQCPKAFANSSYLSQHMRIHQGLKPYTCDICTRKFTQLSHLQQHKRTHTGDKPYKCNYMNCTKQFSQLSNLQSHSRCHQLDKPYKCNSCYKCFHDEQSLLEHIPRHLESKHLKRNLCIFCGSSYQQEKSLVKHFQQYHTDKSPTLVAAAIAAGTTGNTSLIASIVSTTTNSSQTKFATPSGGSISTSGVSSVSSAATNGDCSNSGGGGGVINLGNAVTNIGHNNSNNSNNNNNNNDSNSGSNNHITNSSSAVAHGLTPLSGCYQIGSGFI